MRQLWRRPRRHPGQLLNRLTVRHPILINYLEPGCPSYPLIDSSVFQMIDFMMSVQAASRRIIGSNWRYDPERPRTAERS
jgi:hypothetical protein